MSRTGYHLYIVSGSRAGEGFELKPGMLCLGRGTKDEKKYGWLLFDDPGVSEHHANFQWYPQEHRFAFEHLSTTSPSRVNGRLIEKTESVVLGSNAQITIGHNNIVLERKSIRLALPKLSFPAKGDRVVTPPPEDESEASQAVEPVRDEAEVMEVLHQEEDSSVHTLQLLPNGFSDLLKKDNSNLLGVGVRVEWNRQRQSFQVVVSSGARVCVQREGMVLDVHQDTVLEDGDVVRVDYCQFLYRRRESAPISQSDTVAADASQLISGYQQFGLIGSGSNGEVYEFRDLAGSSVAVKFLFAHLLRQEDVQKRFRHEARVSISLDHPGVLRVIDVGQASDNRMYIMSEYLPGGTLRDRIDRGALPLQEALEIAVDLCDALDYLHGKEIVHRDVKPSNIFFRKGRAVLADFGLVKGADLSTATKTGFTAGTPHYMSPEQFRGYTDARSDQYSLGIVLYELLTGRKPFNAEEPIALAYQHVHDKPRPLRLLRPRLKSSIASAVDRMIAKDVNDRFPNMRAVRSALTK